ncbi:MAG: SnoaL-like domain-containing protein [Methylococcaceae bacterium]|nr:SnoaL-like domain-containing protein [Methylococcaceae bacterium]
MNPNAQQLIENYYAAFNAGDMPTFLNLLTDDVIHDINQGKRESGKIQFGHFMQRMNHHYREQLIDIVVMTNADGARAAAEFVVLGEYLNTDEGLPVANGQRYRLPAGAFFDIRDGKVARITNYYNLEDWIAQVVTPSY